METQSGSYELSQESFIDEVADILLGEDDERKSFIIDYLNADNSNRYMSIPEYDHIYFGVSFLTLDIARMEQAFARIGLNEETFFEIYGKLDDIPERVAPIPKEFILAKIRLLAAALLNGLNGIEKELEIMKADFREGIIESYAADNISLPPQLKIGLSGRERDYYEYVRNSFQDQTAHMQNAFEDKVKETLKDIDECPDNVEILNQYRKSTNEALASVMDFLLCCKEERQYRSCARWELHPDHMVEDILRVDCLRHFFQQQQETD